MHHISTTAEWNRLLGDVYSAPSLETFIEAAFRLLRATIACEAVAFHSLNEDQCSAVVVASDSLDYDPRILIRALSAGPASAPEPVCGRIKVFDTRLESSGGSPKPGDPGPSSDRVPDRAHRHCLCLLFWGQRFFGVPEIAFLLVRDGGCPNCSAYDLKVLEIAQSHLEVALRGLKTRIEADVLREGLTTMARDLPVASLLLDWDLGVVHANRNGLREYASWSNGSALHLKLERKPHAAPPEIEQACREMQAEWTESMRERPFSRLRRCRRILHPGGLLQAIVTLIPHRSGQLVKPHFLILIERREQRGDETGGISPPSLALLTVSEREVALRTTEGLSNQEIASQIGKSVAAVKFLLHSTYSKLNVSSRARLVALLRRAQAPPPAAPLVEELPAVRPPAPAGSGGARPAGPTRMEGGSGKRR